MVICVVGREKLSGILQSQQLLSLTHRAILHGPEKTLHSHNYAWEVYLGHRQS